MDGPELAIDGMAVVVLGEFAPRLVTPRWLRQKDLIGAEDFDSYEAEFVSPNATVGKFGSIELKVLDNALEITTESVADVEAARDLAVGILLSGSTSSISVMGINRTAHFAAGLESYHAIGDALAPKSVWNGLLHLPGMAGLNITGLRDDGNSGAVNVQVQPSNRIRPGVFVSVNDHYGLTRSDPPTDRNGLPVSEQESPRSSAEKTKFAVQVLTEGFASSRNRAKAIIDRVASLGTATEGRQ